MLLKELTLHDFRTYGGRQSVDLAPKSKSKPIVLFGGLNGAGKTTLLDALQLVLYGARAKCASRGDMGYAKYLRQAIHRRANPESGASIELTFDHAQEGRVAEYRVRRTWSATPSRVQDRVEVEVDGEFDPVLTEQWEERVDDFAPHRVSQLFFFDGEKIADLAEEGTSSDVLKTAIHSLFGLDLVDRLKRDLEILNVKRKREGKVDFDLSRSEALEQEKSRLDKEIQETVDLRSAKLGELDRLQKKVDSAQSKYKTEGGELAEQRSQLESELRQVQAQVEGIRAQLREAAHGVLPMAAVLGLISEVEVQVGSEDRLQQQALLGEMLEDRDREVLSNLEEGGLKNSYLRLVIQAFERDRAARVLDSEEAAIHRFGPEERKYLHRVGHGALEAATLSASEFSVQLESLLERQVLIERKLQGIPEEGELIDLREKRATLLASLERVRVELESTEERLRQLQAMSEAVSESYLRELEKHLAAAQEHEGLARKLNRIHLAQDLLATFRSEVLDKNIGRVESAVLESFQELIRKPNLLRSLTVDAESFDLELIGGDDRELKREHLSAGEKQLLAIAMLWGLARTSGLPLPVAIDTPLGRLDSEHRSHLMERYFPKASHQVLLLSTDEEIKQTDLTGLEPFIGRSYLLEYSEDEDRTLIREGYF